MANPLLLPFCFRFRRWLSVGRSRGKDRMHRDQQRVAECADGPPVAAASTQSVIARPKASAYLVLAAQALWFSIVLSHGLPRLARTFFLTPALS
jgi:hypothetical protein